MDEEDLLAAFLLVLEEVEHLGAVAVGGEAVHHHYVGLQFVVLAVEFEALGAVAQFAAGGLGGAVADDEDGVLRAAHRVAQVVLAAAGVHHTRGGDDDGRPLKKVEGFGLVDVLDVREIVEAEGVVVRQHILL